LKKIILSYLQFSKKERIGLAIVLFLLGLFLYLPSLIKPRIQALAYSDTAWFKRIDYVAHSKAASNKKDYAKPTVLKPTYFYFDPNNITENQLVLLGLTEKNAQTILRYRNKGGKFREPKYFLKIWGIEPAVAKALIPYIRIVLANSPSKYPAVNISGGYNPTYTPQKIPIIEVNSASIIDWDALPGIGPVLANRIVRFRDKLGGFAEINDVQKTYGISDSLFSKIKPYLQLNITGKPSINTAGVALLQKAGVSSTIAIAIVEYRTQYGLFASLDELKKIVFIQPAQLQELFTLVKL
jgi:competence protein ComEA